MRISLRPVVLTTVVGVSLAALSVSVASGANPQRQERAADYPLLVVAFHTTPKRPKAGQPFLALAAILNQETGEPVSGSLQCRGRIGRRGVRATFKRLDTGVAGCGWTIPAGTGGKRFRGSIVVNSDDGYQASVPFSRAIRR